MLSGIQIKMARAALGWGVRDLAKEAGINPGTVTRIESGGGIQASSLEKIERTLVGAGIEFIPENGGTIGVKIKKKK